MKLSNDEMIRSMLNMQDTLNIESNGEDWKSGYTKNNRKIDWFRGMRVEAIELLDSFPWKHWKDIDKTIDEANVKIEITDIWQFLLSNILLLNNSDIDDKIELIENERKYVIDKFNIINDKRLINRLYVIEQFIEQTFDKNNPVKLLDRFFCVLYVNDMTLEDLYFYYIGKNVLNKFRQDNGYKEGTYRKMWNGEEDNVWLYRMLEKDGGLSVETIYDKLEEYYNLLT